MPAQSQRIAAICLAALGLIAAPSAADEVRVFAASSLTDALGIIGQDFERQTGHSVVHNFAGSGTLAVQIESGARADVFVSADEVTMDRLELLQLLTPGTRYQLLSNTLVAVVGTRRPIVMQVPGDLCQSAVRRIALAEPASVPAGRYAESYLQRIGLWTRLAGKILPVDNVRAALAAVESGSAEAAFVYATDAMLAKRARIAFEVRGTAAPAISYPVARLTAGRNPAAGAQYSDFLRSDSARAVFERCGFAVLRPARGAR